MTSLEIGINSWGIRWKYL